MPDDVDSLIPIDELRAELSLIEGGAFTSIPDQELLDRIQKIHGGFRLTAPILPQETAIFRAVRVAEKPFYKARLSYPPLSRIYANGLLNRVGEAMFYGSLDQYGPCLVECRCAEGENFAVSVWKTTKPIVLNHRGYSREVIDRVKATRDLPPWSEGKEDDERNALIRAWQARVFTRVVPEGQEHLYRLGIALRDFALDRMAHVDPNLPDFFAGILYPTIATGLLGDNIALRPSVVETSLRLEEVIFLTVNSIVESPFEGPPKQYHLRENDFAKAFRSDGRLVWNQESTALSVSPVQIAGSTFQA
jgi:hypothetical protein